MITHVRRRRRPHGRAQDGWRRDFVEILNQHGVEYIIGSPGSEWPPLWEALSRRRAEGEPAPTYINCRHEGLAVGIAAGYHRATRKLPAVILHTTSGGLNCATNLRGALHNGTPMLVVAGESISYGDGDTPDPGAQWLAGLSEIGGPTRLLAPVMKWAITVRTAYNLADTFHRACQIAMRPPMGPVFVNAPLELMLEQIARERLPHPPEIAAVPQVDRAALEQVAGLLMEAHHPVIFTEAAGKEPEAVDALVELAELLALPVVEAAAPACTNFPTDHPAHQGYSPRPFLTDADVILLVESATPWHPPSKGPGPGCKVISISQDPDLTLRPYSGYPCDIQIHGPAATNLQALTADCARPERALRVAGPCPMRREPPGCTTITCAYGKRRDKRPWPPRTPTPLTPDGCAMPSTRWFLPTRSSSMSSLSTDRCWTDTSSVHGAGATCGALAAWAKGCPMPWG